VKNSRYSRVFALGKFSEEALEAVGKSRVCVIGAGTLGAGVAHLCATYGFGKLGIIDFDTVNLENLGASPFFEEDDLNEKKPKAMALTEKLRKLNSAVEVEPLVIHLDSKNAEETLSRFDLILDGLDNFRTRFLVNDVAVKKKIPYIYAGIAGEKAVLMPVLPGGACLRCLIPRPPLPGESPPCAIAGLDPALALILASLEVDTAVGILGNKDGFVPSLYRLSSNPFEVKALEMPRRNPDCPCCAKGEFSFLEGAERTRINFVCGDDSLEVSLPGASIDFAKLEQALARSGHKVSKNPYFLRVESPEGIVYTLFPQGKVVMKGSTESSKLDAFIASYLGV